MFSVLFLFAMCLWNECCEQYAGQMEEGFRD